MMFRLLLLLPLGLLALQGQDLRLLCEQRGIKLGAAADPTRILDTKEIVYAATLGWEFNQIEPENAMKFGPIHPSQASYSFGPADTIVNFSNAVGQVVRGHTLVWHSQNPDWLTKGNFSSKELSDILQSHINTVVGRYAGRVYAWDVVNEAFNDNGTIRSTIWSDSPGIGLTGTAYIEQALRWANSADPKALLFYNDYSAEGMNAKSNAVYAMAKDFVTRKVPLHGIGLQMHLTLTPGSLADIDTNIKRITDLGLQVHFTELDVRLPVDSSGNATAAALATQAQIYHDVVAICLKYPLCTAIQTWGVTDKYSWIPSVFPGFGAALLFDTSYKPKPAYNSFRDALAQAAPVISASGLVSAASYEGNGVAPGEIVVLYGNTFGPSILQLPQLDGGKVSSNLSSARLLFDGVPAPLIYARVGQVSAVVPFAVEGKTTTQMQYEYQGVKSNAVTVPVLASKPAIFTLDTSGTGAGAILDPNYQVITASNPARKGGVILVFGTGGGAMTDNPQDGALAGVPLPQIRDTVSATIGGVDCKVLYKGALPGGVLGALQFNIEVAAGVPSGVRPIVITIGNKSSPSAVTVVVE